VTVSREDNEQDKLLADHARRIRTLEKWQEKTDETITRIMESQATQQATLKLITRLFWAVFAVTVIKLIAGFFL